MKGSTSLDPSEWISGLLQTCVADGATAFDLACGSGRHSVLCRDLKFKVTAFDRNSDLKVNFDNKDFLTFDNISGQYLLASSNNVSDINKKIPEFQNTKFDSINFFALIKLGFSINFTIE